MFVLIRISLSLYEHVLFMGHAWKDDVCFVVSACGVLVKANVGCDSLGSFDQTLFCYLVELSQYGLLLASTLR